MMPARAKANSRRLSGNSKPTARQPGPINIVDRSKQRARSHGGPWERGAILATISIPEQPPNFANRFTLTDQTFPAKADLEPK